jgi:hypothetical protein
LPTRDEAYSQLLGAFNGVLMMFALALEALKTQKTPPDAPTEGATIPQASA